MRILNLPVQNVQIYCPKRTFLKYLVIFVGASVHKADFFGFKVHKVHRVPKVP
jgi:hypothetical protein